MSVNRKSSVYDLINPCQISETNRAQAFLEAEASSYQGGTGEIRFTLPTSEIMDMTESYIDCLVQLNETDPEVPTVYSLDLTGFTGTYQFVYDGLASIPIAHDAPASGPGSVQEALEDLPTIGGSAFTVAVSGASPTYTLNFSNFVFGTPIDQNRALEISFVAVTTPLTGTGVTLTQPGELAYPRLEYLAPIIRQVRVDVDSRQIVSITSANILQNMVQMFRSVPARYSQFYMNDQNVAGFRSSSQFRIRINLEHVDILKKILPLRYMNRQFRIYLQLEQNNIALVQKKVGGIVSQGTYSIESPRLHYHRIELTDQEVASIEGALDSGGIVIPFQNWTNFTDNISSGTGNKNILFNPAVSNLLCVFFVMIPQDYASEPENLRKTSIFLRNRIGSYRLKLGSRYFPLDQVDSVQPGNNDMVEPILELEHAISKIMDISGEQQFDRVIYFNYNGGIDGNDPDQFYYNVQYNEERRPTWVGGISTADTPHNQWGYICRSDALSGQNVEMLSNVSLELRDLSLSEDNTLQIYTLHQDFLHITRRNVQWIK